MNNKSQKYIVIFTVLLVAILVVVMFTKNNDSSAPSGTGNIATKAPNQNKPQVAQDVTKGNPDTTLNADISFREINFSLTQDDILNKEKSLKDTLDDPVIAKSADGYTYITFESNPDQPISYNGFQVAASGTRCITYVLNNGSLEEARLQFGPIDSAETTGIISNINSQYGEYTFYRSTNGTQTYWWKGNNAWLMLTSDSVGTTLFLRKA